MLRLQAVVRRTPHKKVIVQVTRHLINRLLLEHIFQAGISGVTGAAYGVVLPSKRHRAVGKETSKTSYIN